MAPEIGCLHCLSLPVPSACLVKTVTKEGPRSEKILMEAGENNGFTES